MNTRRRFLRNMSYGTGAVLLAPITTQVRAHADGKKTPTRYVFVLQGNGFRPDHFTPIGYKRPAASKFYHQGVTKLVNESLVDKEMTNVLSPFNKYKQQLTIVHGLSGRIGGGGHSSDFGALTCRPNDGNRGPTGMSIDVELGIRQGGVFKHVGLGMVNSPNMNVVYNCSSLGSKQRLPTLCNPMTAYNTLFGSVAGKTSKAEFNAKNNLLDFLVKDIKRLEKEVPSADRSKFHAHLKGYEDMRHRASRLGEIEDSLRKAKPEASDKYKSEVASDRLDAQFDIAAASLIGGLTNSVTIASGVGRHLFDVSFKGIGIPISNHQIGHQKSGEGKTYLQLREIIHKFHTGLIVRLMDKLKAVPEGDGNMLDNTVIVFMSDGAESHHSHAREWPIMLLPGKNTGIKAGQYIDYPYYGLEGHRETGNLFTTLLHAAGDERKYFGLHDLELQGKSETDGPLGELLL